MKFKAQPNLTVRFRGTRPIKYIRFNANGTYETTDEFEIKRLKARFTEVKPTKKKEDKK